MAVVWCRESVGDRSLDKARDNGGSAARSFLVRVDAPSTSLADIAGSPGIDIGDAHPDDAGLRCEAIKASAKDDSGLLYVVSLNYKPNLEAPEMEELEGQGANAVEGLMPYWSASSSVGSQPVWKDVNGVVMTNSAGDPLEGLEAEFADFHLTKTTFFKSHAAVNGDEGWLSLSRQYTNACNNNLWNGGNAGTWKCKGSSAKLTTDNQGPSGARRVYWEVTWEFAFREEGWQLMPWDIGFNELVDEEGNPEPHYGISVGDGGEDYGSGGGSGGGDDQPCPGGPLRRAIKGQDGKPVRQPVALDAGVAKAPCLRPSALWFQITPFLDFDIFGEVFTPTVS